MNDGNISGTPAEAHRHPNTRDALRAALLELVRAARSEFRLASPVLDPIVFRENAVTDELGHFLARRAGNRILMIAEDTEQMLTTLPRLVDLARRFSDLFLLRRLGETHHGLIRMFAIADHTGCLVQPDIGRFDATLDLAAPHLAIPLVRQFEEFWAGADPVPGLHMFKL